MPALTGAIYRAVAPFAPEPPFRVYAGERAPPLLVDETPKLTEAETAEFTILTPVKARPVLVIAEPRSRYGELLVLRLRRLSRLTASERAAVLAGEADDLFHLDPELCPGLQEENAALVSTMTRLPVSAMDLARPLGRLGRDQLRTIHERLVGACDLDLHDLVVEQAREMVADW
jgi:hypothetical protein